MVSPISDIVWLEINNGAEIKAPMNPTIENDLMCI